MRLLIISDLHLSHRNFDQRRLNYICNLISKYDRVIINGDFWCAFTSTFDQFLNSKWAELFKILLKHRCVYIEGNHDLFNYADDRLKRFCVSYSSSYELVIGGIIAIILHDPRPKVLNKRNRSGIFLRRATGIERIPLYFGEILANTANLGLLRKNLGQQVNKRQKKIINRLKDNKLYIVSHTHYFEYDEGNNYVNTGCVGKRQASYVSIENGKVSLEIESF